MLSDLSDDQWNTLSALLDELLDLPEVGHSAWLTSLRERDPLMAGRIEESLNLSTSDAFQGFLQGASLASMHNLTDATLVGRRIGSYTIDAEIGRGGMGAVWRAQRVDGRYEGNVAIKFMHPGLIGSGELRFQQEGRLLSRLDHPNIARLLDAGVLDRTQPYLVLEYVQGEPLDAYCDRRNLPLRARLELFLHVVDAVAHAHANLIVHRDLKPGNVLVTAAGAVKLLDFGVAKLIDDAQGSAAETRLIPVALTPLYAAPEQLLGKQITTATDVYALGLMLYVLLTGRHATADKLQSREQIIQSTLTTEPPRASKVAQLPEVEARALAGDLDSVLYKAIEKLPAARYESASAFADDLRRFLADEPVRARPDSAGYRARKFVARHRLGADLSAIALTALTTVAIVSAVQTQRASRAAAVALSERKRADAAAHRAEEQRDLALASIARSQDVTELTAYLLGEALPDDQPQLREQVLLRGVSMVRSAKATPAPLRAAMLEMIGQHFENVRDFEHATQVYEEAHSLGAAAADVGVMANTTCHLAQMQAAQGRSEEALAASASALASLPPGSKYADPRVICHLERSQILFMHGESGLLDLEAASKDLRDFQVPNPWLESDVVSLLVGAYSSAMRMPEALGAIEREETLIEQTGSSHIRLASVFFSNASVFYWKIGRPLDARASLERSEEIDQERGARERDNTVSLIQRARIAGQLGDTRESLRNYDRALAMAKASKDGPSERIAMGERLQMLVQAGRYSEAERATPQAERRLHDLFAPTHWMWGVLAMQSALLAEHRRQPEQAQQLADDAIHLFEQGPARDSYQYPIALVQKSAMEYRGGRTASARADAEKALTIYKERFGSIRSASIGDALTSLGNAAKAGGDSDFAASQFRQATQHYESSLGPDHPKTRAVLMQ